MLPTPDHQHPRTLLRPFHGVGLFITATNTDTGKTTVTAALAAALHRLRLRVGICKPIASGCPMRIGHTPASHENLTNDDLSSPDAEFALRAAGFTAADSIDPNLLQYASPVRYAIPVSPHIAARIENRPIDWTRIVEAFNYWEENCDVLLVEGAGGWLVPLDDHHFTIADLAAALHLPVLIVTDAGIGTFNYTTLTVHAIRQRGLVPAGLVINHVPQDAGSSASPHAAPHTTAMDPLILRTNIEELPKVSGVPLRAVFPQLPQINPSEDSIFPREVPTELVDLIAPFAEQWWNLAHAQAKT